MTIVALSPARLALLLVAWRHGMSVARLVERLWSRTAEEPEPPARRGLRRSS
mgnify:CR=1 FL=1